MTTHHYLLHRTVARGATPEHVIEVARLAVSEMGLEPTATLHRLELAVTKVKSAQSSITFRNLFSRDRTDTERRAIETGNAVLDRLRAEIRRVESAKAAQDRAILADPEHPMHDYLRRGDL